MTQEIKLKQKYRRQPVVKQMKSKGGGSTHGRHEVNIGMRPKVGVAGPDRKPILHIQANGKRRWI